MLTEEELKECVAAVDADMPEKAQRLMVHALVCLARITEALERIAEGK